MDVVGNEHLRRWPTEANAASRSGSFANRRGLVVKPQVVILGAGFAGHTAALHLIASRRRQGRRHGRRAAQSLHVVSQPDLGGNRSDVARRGALRTRAGIRENRRRLRRRRARPRSNPTIAKSSCKRRRERSEHARVRFSPQRDRSVPQLRRQRPASGPTGNDDQRLLGRTRGRAPATAISTIVEDLKAGKRRRIVVGVGHPAATCEGAAFEYLMNVHADLRARGIRDAAELVWLTNEPEAGDFGVDGIEALKRGVARNRRGARAHDPRRGSDRSADRGAGVTKVDPGVLHYEQIGEDPGTLEYDFAMLIPQFRGIPIKYVASDGSDITEEMTVPSGFMSVDADYAPKTFRGIPRGGLARELSLAALRQRLRGGHRFRAAASASRKARRPQAASRLLRRRRAPAWPRASWGAPSPRTSRNKCAARRRRTTRECPRCRPPASRRWGSPSGTDRPRRSSWRRSLATTNATRSTAAISRLCDLDVGLAGAWTKRALHSAFLWKLQAKPGWQLIPE